MSVKIRLARAGGKKDAFFRIVATDHRNPRDGRFIELLGVYDPMRNPPEFRYNEERVTHWMKHGAKLTDTIRNLIKRAKIEAAKAAK